MTRKRGDRTKSAVVSAKDARQKAWKNILQAISHNTNLLAAIRRSLFPARPDFLVEGLWNMASKHMTVPLSPSCNIFSLFLEQCSQLREHVPKNVGKAIEAFVKARDIYTRRRKELVYQCHLNLAGDTDAHREKRSAFLATCKQVTVEEHATPYPPSQHWVAEDKEVYNAWKTWCDSHTLKDKREGHFPVHRLNEDALAYTAEADESVLFYDASGKLVAFVIRDFCHDQKIVDAIAEDISQGRFYKKSVRVSLTGYSWICYAKPICSLTILGSLPTVGIPRAIGATRRVLGGHAICATLSTGTIQCF